MSMPASAEEEELRLLTDLIEAQFGLVFGYGRQSLLESRLEARLSALGLPRIRDYYHYLLFSPQKRAELDELKKIATNNESYFFRADHQLKLLKSLATAPLFEGKAPLRVLSAGCSSGEEAYSLAMVLRSLGPELPRGYDIDALDLHPDKIEYARRGVYGENSLRGCDATTKAQYFDSLGPETYSVKAEYRRNIRFFEHNLVSDAVPSALAYDVIFCRNVLIYFSPVAFEKAISAFARWLKPSGYLVLGHSESLVHRRTPFTPEILAGSVVYRVMTHRESP